MITLLISIILLALKLAGVITWSYWIVASPALCLAAWSTFLLVKAEFVYLKSLKNKPAEE